MSRWWSCIPARLREWAHRVGDEVASWRGRDAYPTNGRRQRALNTFGTGGAPHRSGPSVRVFRDGPDVVVEAEDRCEWAGKRDGIAYQVCAYKYERRRAPATTPLGRADLNVFFGDRPFVLGMPPWSWWDAPRRVRLLFG